MTRYLLSLLTSVLLVEHRLGRGAHRAARCRSTPAHDRALRAGGPQGRRVQAPRRPRSGRWPRLVQAAQLMDTLFLRQAWAGNETLLLELRRGHLARWAASGSTRSSSTRARGRAWTRAAPSSPASPPAPLAAGNFYPAGATKEEIEAWVKTLPEAQQRQATGFYTTIRRGPDGKFITVPYSVEYQGELALAAQLLREAAALTQQPTLKTFLTARADAFLSNDYYASEVAWMELDASVEPTIGPYEVYEDDWFNYKAAFEAFITVRDDAETQKLATLRRRAAGAREQPAHRSEAAQPEARRAGAHPRRQQPVLLGRRQPRRADGRLQPAQRRARHRGEGQQARDAQERAGGQVPARAPAHRQGGARPRRTGRTSPSRPSSPTSSCTS